jgi:hypothetical protein
MGASAAFLEGNKPINPQVFLGAGFSATAGVPLASQLFRWLIGLRGES